MKPWWRLRRVYFFEIAFRSFEPIYLLQHFIRVKWPEAAALLDKLVDDSLQLLFFILIEHKIWNLEYQAIY